MEILYRATLGILLYIEVIVKMASFSSYHFIPASLPTRKAPELQKLVARQSKD